MAETKERGLEVTTLEVAVSGVWRRSSIRFVVSRMSLGTPEAKSPIHLMSGCVPGRLAMLRLCRWLRIHRSSAIVRFWTSSSQSTIPQR